MGWGRGKSGQRRGGCLVEAYSWDPDIVMEDLHPWRKACGQKYGLAAAHSPGCLPSSTPFCNIWPTRPAPPAQILAKQACTLAASTRLMVCSRDVGTVQALFKPVAALLRQICEVAGMTMFWGGGRGGLGPWQKW